MPHPKGEKQETVFVWSSSDIRKTTKEARTPRAPAQGRPDAGPDAGADHRRYPRLDLQLPILYRLVEEDAARMPLMVRPYLLAQSQDVSPIGLCLSLEEPLTPGTVLALTIHAVEWREKFDALARVVWSRPAGEAARHLVGLQFVVMDGRRVREDRHARVEALVRSLECQPEAS